MSATASTSPAFPGITDDHHILSRVRRWMRYRRELAGFVIDVLCVLVAERATGRLTIDISEGSASIAEFEERAKLSDPS